MPKVTIRCNIVIPKADRGLRMRRTILFAAVFVIIGLLNPSDGWASRAPLRYVDGTLSLKKWTQGFLEHSDEREFAIRWVHGEDTTSVLYRRIIFAEFGVYVPHPVLEFLSGRDNKPHRFLTLVYLDEWQHTQIMELELKRDSEEFAESVRNRTESLMKNAPNDATSLADAYGSSIRKTSRQTRIWASTLQGVTAGAATVEVEPGGAIVLTQSNVEHRLEPASVTSLEFDEKVGSGALRAIVLSAAVMDELPLFMMTKKVNHLLTVTLVSDGIPQVVVLE